MKKRKVAIVVPTIRENSIVRFLEEWEEEFFNNREYSIKVFLIEDNHEKTFNLSKYKGKIIHYSWSDIEMVLGKNSWIIPRRTDCVRSFGYLMAYKSKPDIIITLDDDCYPLKKYLKSTESSLIKTHWDALMGKKEEKIENAWISTIKKLRPRGIPYKKFERRYESVTALNHGLWYNVPDFDGTTQLASKKTSGLHGYAINQDIPKDKFFPMCGMNIAWKNEVTPAMYFLLMGQDIKGNHWGYDRFGDIWCGIFLKKIVDHLNFNISSGNPIIWHDRASNPLTNIKKERTGVKVNEYLWQKIDNLRLTKSSFKDCYVELSEKLDLKGEYWENLKKAMKIWASLF